MATTRKAVPQSMSGGGGGGGGDGAGVVLAIIGGLLGLGLLYELTRAECPVCKAKIQRGIPACPQCRTVLSWKSP